MLFAGILSYVTMTHEFTRPFVKLSCSLTIWCRIEGVAAYLKLLTEYTAYIMVY